MTDALPASAPALPKFAAALTRLWPHGDAVVKGLVEGHRNRV